jgi:hypothetical protein
MATYGYQLFTVEIFRGRKRAPMNFKSCDGEHYLAVVYRLLKALTIGPWVGDPHPDADDAVESVKDESEALDKGYRDKPVFRVEEVSKTGNTVRGTVWSGRVGSHEMALSAEDASEDTDISDKAASRRFRFVLALPSDGAVGILAVEVISRSSAAKPLVRWLQWKSQEEAKAGSRIGSNTADRPRSWWRLRVSRLTDEEHLAEMIKNGRAQKLELVKYSVTPARTRKQEELHITAPLLDGSKVSQVLKLVRTWSSRPELDETPDTTTDREAAKQLAGIVGPEIARIDLDDGWVILQDDEEKTKRISPSRVSEIFTYTQSTDGRRVDTPTFYHEVRGRAVRLQQAHNLMIDWPPH